MNHKTYEFNNKIQKNLNKHSRVHTSHSGSNFLNKCPIPSCQSTFPRACLLQTHLRIHNNDFEQCQYCPFKYVFPHDYQHHLRRHFGIKDFKCDQCGKSFISKPHLNKHYARHEGIIHHCLLCEDYKASCQNSMHTHLSRKHPEVVGKIFTWESVEKFVKITK